MRALSLALVLFALLFAGTAYAEPPATHYPQLDAFASRIAHRPVTVRCPTPEEEAEDSTFLLAWAYVPWDGGPEDYAVVQGFICDETLALAEGKPSPSGDEWRQALAILVLTHESYHLWKRGGNSSEAVTECRAIKRFPRAVVELGGTPQLANSLLAEALWIHQYGFAEGYALKGCKLPEVELP